MKINSARKEAELNSLKLEVEKYRDIELIDEKPEIRYARNKTNRLKTINSQAK